MDNKKPSDGLPVLYDLPSIPISSPMVGHTNPSIHFVGLGGAGTNILEDFYKRGIQAKYTYITHTERTNLPLDINFVQFVPPNKSDGLAEKGIWLESDMDQPLTIPIQVEQIFSQNDHYLLLAGLGGYTGTFMTDALCQRLLLKNKNFAVICNTPLSFEGPMRSSYASKIIEKFRHQPNFKYFDLEAVMEEHGKNTIQMAHEHFYSIFAGILSKLTKAD